MKALILSKKLVWVVFALQGPEFGFRLKLKSDGLVLLVSPAYGLGSTRLYPESPVPLIPRTYSKPQDLRYIPEYSVFKGFGSLRERHCT